MGFLIAFRRFFGDKIQRSYPRHQVTKDALSPRTQTLLTFALEFLASSPHYLPTRKYSDALEPLAEESVRPQAARRANPARWNPAFDRMPRRPFRAIDLG